MSSPKNLQDKINLWVITSDNVNHAHAELILRNYLHSHFTPMQLAFNKVQICMHQTPHPFKDHLKAHGLNILDELVNSNIQILMIWDGVCPRTKGILKLLRKSGDKHITQFASKPRKFRSKNSS